MLNRLYGVMDFLAGRFGLFKIETIGDAYVCACGLPESDVNHAANVANFAIAVKHCCKTVKSPLDGSPIQLRIGVHSGACASGIVGVTNPRYCVFGDTVNTTARHESTGAPGRVHCSLTTMMELQNRAVEDFNVTSRGMVEMKGKGVMPTYWLEATQTNCMVNEKALNALDEEVGRMAKRTPPEPTHSSPSPRKMSPKALSLADHMKEAKLSDGPKPIASDLQGGDSDSTNRSHSSSSGTPSRKELARLLSRSNSSGSQAQRPSRRRRNRNAVAKDSISKVLEVVEKGDSITSPVQ